MEEIEEKRRVSAGTHCDECKKKAKGKKFRLYGKRHLCESCRDTAQAEESTPYRKPKKITAEEFNEFKQDFFAGAYKPMRFGQAFLNQFYPDIVDSKLFYETRTKDAEALAWNTYVKV